MLGNFLEFVGDRPLLKWSISVAGGLLATAIIIGGLNEVQKYSMAQLMAQMNAHTAVASR